MSETIPKPNEGRSRGVHGWLTLWLTASVAHFSVLIILSSLLAWSAYAKLLIPLAFFAEIMEGVLRKTTNYRGEDIIQWPIIFANSLLYGAGIAWAIDFWGRRRGTRRVQRGSGNHATPESQWCLVGNIIGERPAASNQDETESGSKHFAAGTKVYCLPPQWGDGYENIKVVGKHRGSRRLVTMVIKSKLVTNWRAKLVYSPDVLRRMTDAGHMWTSKKEVETMLKSILEYERARVL